jgi:prephenate dehydratase
MKRIAYFGPPGSFSDESARYFFAGEEVEFVPYKLIYDVFMSTVSGRTDWSVIPVENTIDGSVSLHLDLLVHEADLPIRAEWIYPVDMNLIGYPNPSGAPEDFSHIRKVLAYHVASAQCRQFLRERLPHAEIEQAGSTAEGVRLVKEKQDPRIAAIGTAMAARIYGVDILKARIQDHPDNFTRFILIGQEVPALRAAGHRKTTILVTLPDDYPGALHQVLSAFAWRRINLSKIESRPTKKKLGSYYFYIDIEAPLESVLLPAALEEIRAIGCQVRIMGTYPSYSYEPSHSEV